MCKVILIMSGKGGVGKSTIAVTLANYISMEYKTLLLDLDLYSPSIPKLTRTEFIIYENLPIPVTPNLKVISSGHFEDYNLNFDFNFSDFEFVIVDTPPGISDVHLNLVNRLCHGINENGGRNENGGKTDNKSKVDEISAIMITTPHTVSFSDLKRQIKFVKKNDIKIYGVIENMKRIICSCGHINQVVDSCIKNYCDYLGIRYLCGLDADIYIAKCCDEGEFVRNKDIRNLARRFVSNMM